MCGLFNTMIKLEMISLAYGYSTARWFVTCLVAAYIIDYLSGIFQGVGEKVVFKSQHFLSVVISD